MACRRFGRATWGRAVVVMLLLVGALLRFSAMGLAPPGLYHDEAQNGVDASSVLDGDLPLYFEANNGREPLFIYLVALSVGVLGRTPLAVRLPSAYIGVLTLAAVYDLGRVLGGRRVGRYALAILAVTFWHVHLSRVGFRAVLLPLFTALYMGQIARGVRTGYARHWIAAGALYGGSWYTYLAARFTPVPLAALALYGWLFHRPVALKLRTSVLIFCVTALLVVLPLGIYTLRHPDVILARGGQVSIWSTVINKGNFWGTLGQHVLRTMGMFFVRGDRIWRHNLAWRPVWEPALGLAFAIGLGVALARFAKDGWAALAIIWTVAMSIPTILAEDAPHFLRGVGVLPIAVLFPVAGLLWLRDRLTTWRWQALLPALFIGSTLIGTTVDYFLVYARAPETHHWFEAGPVALAGLINQAIGTGWDGSRMRNGPDSGLAVYMDPQLWDSWTAVSWLLPQDRVHFLPAAEVVDPDAGVLFVVWPYRDWEPDVLPLVAHPRYLRIVSGPLAQGDRDPGPFNVALLLYVTPRPEVPPPIARFGEGLLLRAALVRELPEGAEIRLWWDVMQPIPVDYKVFVHYLRNGERIAQHDGQPGYGYLPTTFWHAGDLVLDCHPVQVYSSAPRTDSLRIGLYTTEGGVPLPVLDGEGQPVADWADIGVIIEQP